MLVGMGVWLCNRQQKKRRTAANKADEEEGEGVEVELEQESEDEHGEDKKRYREEKKEHLEYLDEKASMRADERPRKDMRARVESSSSSEGTPTPPPPHPAHVNLAKQGTIDVMGSPVETKERTLYPSNPSPNPRHLNEGEHHLTSAMRSSTYSRRQSMASVHFAGGGVQRGVPPPMPISKGSARTNTGTPPLNIRKSTFEEGRRPSGSIPSYYEATRGQPLPRPISRAERHAPRSRSPPDAPPVPVDSHPRVEVRRPSAPDARRPSTARKPSADRGGMI